VALRLNQHSGDYSKLITTALPMKKVAFITSFPPRQCGIATFANDVIQAITGHAPAIEPLVIAMEESCSNAGRLYPEMVKWLIPQHERPAYSQAADYINRSGAQLLCVQHEFGLFGGEAGDWLLDTLNRVKMPVVTVLHTVLPDPAPEYRRVMLELARRSERLVVMSQTAARLMQTVYGVAAHKLGVIYHGVPNVPFLPTRSAKALLGLENHTVLATFGLINKGKGIEYAIEALPEVVARYPDLLYLVLGETHPVVRQREGEHYRESLVARVHELGLQDHVRFENRYLDFDDLCRYLKATDIYLTPYLGRDQIVSGTLAYAMGFGKAVISTPYLYAEEVLADERGLLVGWKDKDSIQAALMQFLGDPALLAQTRRNAYTYGHAMAWPNVGHQFVNLFTTLVEGTQLLPAKVKTAVSAA
jgi:glycosyltransferase involved in cell wall biosynthesis